MDKTCDVYGKRVVAIHPETSHFAVDADDGFGHCSVEYEFRIAGEVGRDGERPFVVSLANPR